MKRPRSELEKRQGQESQVNDTDQWPTRPLKKMSQTKEGHTQTDISAYETNKQDQKRTSQQHILVKPPRERTKRESNERCKRKQNKTQVTCKKNPSEYQLISQWKL